jgi:hypothetical protein
MLMTHGIAIEPRAFQRCVDTSISDKCKYIAHSKYITLLDHIHDH